MAVVVMRHKRKGPARHGQPSPKQNTTIRQSNGHRRQDGYAAPDFEDRREAALLAEAAEMGYRLATVCVDCGHWLANPVSVALHRGPICRARAGVEQ
jgi:hypothetical protein